MELLEIARTYGGAIALVATTVVILLSSKFMTRDAHALDHAKLTSRLDALTAKVEKAEEDIVLIRSDIDHMPDKETAHRMEMAIARLEGRLETMDERLKPVAAMASRMQDHLLTGGRS